MRVLNPKYLILQERGIHSRVLIAAVDRAIRQTILIFLIVLLEAAPHLVVVWNRVQVVEYFRFSFEVFGYLILTRTPG